MTNPIVITEQIRETAQIEIAAERRRQIKVEGWTSEHDDAHADGEMLDAAVIYLWWGTDLSAPLHTITEREDRSGGRGDCPIWVNVEYQVPQGWPWAARWWKPKNRRRNIVRAGALCLAEKDRLIRLGRAWNHASHKYSRAVDELAMLLARGPIADCGLDGFNHTSDTSDVTLSRADFDHLKNAFAQAQRESYVRGEMGMIEADRAETTRMKPREAEEPDSREARHLSPGEQSVVHRTLRRSVDVVHKASSNRGKPESGDIAATLNEAYAFIAGIEAKMTKSAEDENPVKIAMLLKRINMALDAQTQKEVMPNQRPGHNPTQVDGSPGKSADDRGASLDADRAHMDWATLRAALTEARRERDEARGNLARSEHERAALWTKVRETVSVRDSAIAACCTLRADLAAVREAIEMARVALRPLADLEIWTDVYPDRSLTETPKERVILPKWVIGARKAIADLDALKGVQP